MYTRLAGDCDISARVTGPTPELALPNPLEGDNLARARLTVRANARASGVFGVFALLLAAFMWALRRYDPSLRGDRASE